MKRKTNIIFTFVIAVFVFCFIIISGVAKPGIGLNKETGFQNKNDSADIIIDKYINALGGKEKLKSINTLYLEGSAIIRGQKTLSKAWSIKNKCSRNESTINGFTSWQIIRNDSGWAFNPRRGQKFPEPMNRDRVKISRFGLDLEGTLVDYKTKGYKVEYRGIDQIEGSDTYKIEETLNDTVTKTFYIDMDSFLVMRIRSKFATPKRTNYSNEDYSNYQKTPEGIMFPMELNNLKYSKIIINQPIADSLFIPKN